MGKLFLHAAGGLAMALLIAAFAEVFQPVHIWGVWLYAGLAGLMLALEVVALIESRCNPSPAP